MKLKTLRLHNFRNFSSAHEVIFPNEPLLVAAAPNATGKTNFLESLHVLLRGRSFRASLSDCVQWGETGFQVAGRINHGDIDSYVSTRYEATKGRLLIQEDEAPISPVTFYSHYPFVLFLPEDSFMFTRGPAMRRNFLNSILISSSPYLSALVQYQRVLKQRNAALKQAVSKEDVEAWTSYLIEYARVIWSARQAFVQFLQHNLRGLYKDFTNEDLPFVPSFIPGASKPESFAEILEEAWLYETKYHYTLYGPHRDDFEITVQGREVKTALSRGQLRSLVLALKVAGYMFMKQTIREEPLLLFDEVLSELDEPRQRAVLAHLPHTQILLTCTHLPSQLKRRDDVYMLALSDILQPPTTSKEPVKEKALTL